MLNKYRLRLSSLILLLLSALLIAPHKAQAAMSFCNRTTGPLEAALGYRDTADTTSDDWISEGWWRIEPGQCSRVFNETLSQRFYFYYAHGLTQTTKDAPPTIWSGKYIFCTDDKAFRVEGDNDCASRNYQSTGFQELDLGTNTRDYTLDFKDTTTK